MGCVWFVNVRISLNRPISGTICQYDLTIGIIKVSPVVLITSKKMEVEDKLFLAIVLE